MSNIAVRALRTGVLLLSALSLSACVNAPPKPAFNHAANASLKRIDVLALPESRVGLDILNHPGFSFGLIGLAVAEANMAPKRNWLEAQVRDHKFDQVAIFRERLTQAMTAKGYELIWSEPTTEDPKHPAAREQNGYRRSYAADPRADAQLDVALNYVGYAAAGAGENSPYRPTVGLSAKLVGADGKAVLMSDQILYNPVFPNTRGAITINADPAYTYPEFNALEASGATALDGLRVALESAADELARQY